MNAVARNVSLDLVLLRRKEVSAQALLPAQSLEFSSSLALPSACSSGTAKGAVYEPISKKARTASPTYQLLQILCSVARIQSKNTCPRCRNRPRGIRTRSPHITTAPPLTLPNARCRGIQQLPTLLLTLTLTLIPSKPPAPKEQMPSLSPLLIQASPITRKLSTTKRRPPSVLLVLLRWITIWSTLTFPTTPFVSPPMEGIPFDPALPEYLMLTGNPI